MEEQSTSLSPRETVLRMLKHMPDDVSYEDIVHQLRILRQIDWVVDESASASQTDGDGANEETTIGAEAASDIQMAIELDAAASYPEETSAIVLRSGPEFSWRSLAERTAGEEKPAPGTSKVSPPSETLLWTD